MTWSTTVTVDPGFTSHTFRSHQFGFNQGTGGYIDMQGNGGEDQLFLFSVWDVNQAKPGSKSSWRQDFGGEGTGYSCHRRTDQGWVHGADRTLRLVNNFGLTAAPEAAGNDKKVPVAITTCAGAPGPLTTWTYGAQGSIVNDATGRCLYAPGGNETGHRVELRDCTGKADQQWTAPRA
ncbi:ricin-type beta-trefoil lectin domain protein [Streptomyces sp. NPDC002596]